MKTYRLLDDSILKGHRLLLVDDDDGKLCKEAPTPGELIMAGSLTIRAREIKGSIPPFIILVEVRS